MDKALVTQSCPFHQHRHEAAATRLSCQAIAMVTSGSCVSSAALRGVHARKWSPWKKLTNFTNLQSSHRAQGTVEGVVRNNTRPVIIMLKAISKLYCVRTALHIHNLNLCLPSLAFPLVIYSFSTYPVSGTVLGPGVSMMKQTLPSSTLWFSVGLWGAMEIKKQNNYKLWQAQWRENTGCRVEINVSVG